MPRFHIDFPRPLATNSGMTVHLIKLSVGPDSLSQLAEWQTQRLRDATRAKQPATLMHVTRNTPRRADELLDGGSIYWVIKGWIVARQKMLELRPLVHNGIPHCGLIYDPQLITVRARKHRPFQGWRYLATTDAPADVGPWNGIDGLPDELQRELSVLGLL